jgi:hypothetical protein
MFSLKACKPTYSQALFVATFMDGSAKHIILLECRLFTSESKACTPPYVQHHICSTILLFNTTELATLVYNKWASQFVQDNHNSQLHIFLFSSLVAVKKSQVINGGFLS